MKSFAFIRVIAWLKRIALALEDANDMKAQELELLDKRFRPRRAWKMERSRPTKDELEKSHERRL